MSKTTTAGEYLSRGMIRQGLSNVELAEKLGLASASNISDWRAGARRIPLNHINEVAKHVGINRATLRGKVQGKSAAATVKTRAKALPPVVKAVKPVVVFPPGTNVTWICAVTTPAPSDRGHVIFNNETGKVRYVGTEEAHLATKEAVSHWAEFGLPNPPVSY